MRITAILVCLLWSGLLQAQYVKGMPYFHQNSNRLDPSGSCQNTCVAMVLKHYGADDITPDDLTARWGTGVAKTTAGLKQLLNTEAQERGLTVRDSIVDNGQIDQLYRLLDEGKPVIVHGRFSVSGHLIVLLGYDENYYYAHDPAGAWRQRPDAGFTNSDDPDIGRYTRYEREAMEKALISADHKRTVRLHALYFVPGIWGAAWSGAMPDSIQAGAALHLDENIRVDAVAETDLRVFADLSVWGGEKEHPLVSVSPGLYRLVGQWRAPDYNGWYQIEITVEGGGKTEKIQRGMYVVPALDQVIYADASGANWRRGFSINADIDFAGADSVYRGDASIALDAKAFTLELLPVTPIVPTGYRALRLAFHPGDVEYSARPALTLQINNDGRKSINLAASQWPGVGIDLEQRGWQIIEVPLSVFYPLEEPIENLRLFGNLRGTFYLDELTLVADGVDPSPTAVFTGQAHSGTFELPQNYPNPFNSSTLIPFKLAQTDWVDLAIYNIMGQRVAQLIKGVRGAGSIEVHWNGRDDRGADLASGVYFYRLSTGPISRQRKMLLLR
jgi:hypothetical protein